MRKFLSLFGLALLLTSSAVAQITSADEIDETKVYTIVSSRATLSQNGNELQSSHSGVTENDYWAFVKYAGNYYLYSVAAQKFVQALPQYGSRLQDYSTSSLNFAESGNASYPIFLRIARWGVNTQTGAEVALNSHVGIDAGNCFAIKEVEGQSFDASAAKAALEEAYGSLTGQKFTLVGDRSGLTMTSGTLKPTGNLGNHSAYETLDANNPYQQFAFVLFKSQLYVYNVGQDKFLYGTNGAIAGRDFEGTIYNILYDDQSNKFMFTYGPELTLNNNNNGGANLDGWIASDGGNVYTLTKIGDFDDTALQAKLNTADVVFTIEDSEGHELGSRTLKRPAGELTNAPTLDELGIRYYSNISLKAPATIEPGTTNSATLVISGWNGPFAASDEFDDNANWYAFNVRQTNIGLVTNEGEMSVTTEYRLDDVLADDVWAFKGNNISGFSIYNKKSGRYLTKPVNPEVDNSNPDKYCYLSDTPNNDWLIMPTGNASENANGAFLLYEKSNEAHKLNQFGGQNSRTLGYYDHLTDRGNFFYASSPIDFVNTVIQEILVNPVGLINGFVSEQSKTTFNSRYNDIASSNNLAEFTALYYDLLDALIKQTTGWYQLENQYTANKYVLETKADGALIGQHTLADAANNINTFVKYDIDTKTVMMQGLYVATHGSSSVSDSLAAVGHKINFSPISGGSCLLAFISNDIDASNSYRNIYFVHNNEGKPYTVSAWFNANEPNCRWYMHPKSSFDITLHEGAAGQYWATMYAPFGYTLPAGVEAYIGTVNEAKNSLYLESIGQNVSAGTPVVLMGSNATVTVTINDEAAATIGENDLIGQYLAYTEQSDELYTLGISDGVVGFYKYDGIIGANKAVLKLTDGTSSNGFKLVFGDDDLTGISGITTAADAQSATYYDLQGRRVVAPQKGQLYIKNGKTIVY